MTQTIFDDLFVLELANNHWGSLHRGLKIIRDFSQVVRFNNVRASIKLQFRDVDSFIHKDYRHREDIRYIKKTLATQMPWEALHQMVQAVRDGGMLTMVTPFDERSVDKCVEFNVDILKIASSDIKDWFLIEKMASTRKPVIASSGGSSLNDIDNLVKFFKNRDIPFALNHCVSIYPSEDHELELNQIDFLRERYPGTVVGLSTHEYHDWANSMLIAYGKGARTFERHVDIDYEGVPVSSYCTLPEQADVWFKAFKKAQEMCGGAASQKRAVPDKEVKYLDALVRGVYAKSDLAEGHVLKDEDVYLAVPLLKGQISCREFMRGEVLKAAVPADQPVNFGSIDSPYAVNSDLGRMIAERGLDPAEPGDAGALLVAVR